MGLLDNYVRKRVKEEIQASTVNPTVLTGPQISSPVINGNRGNQFTTSAATARELDKCYRNKAQYGNSIVKTLINYRTGWIAGNGANITADGSSEEQDFVSRFVADNKLDGRGLLRWVRGGEIEGRALLLITSEGTGSEAAIKVRHLPYSRFLYDIEAADDDYENITKMTYTDGAGETQILLPDDFVYVNLDNSGGALDEPVSATGSVLTNCVNMDKALADYREYNHEIASVGLHYETQDLAGATSIRKAISAVLNWARKNTLAAPAKAYYPEPSGNGAQSLENEITLNAKLISGESGVPIHLLGWASEMSNRATAEELVEQIYAQTAEPREIWISALIEITVKAIIKYNKITSKNLSTEKIDATLAMVSRQQIKELIEVWMPLHDGGYISEETVMMRIPGIDVEDEQEKKQKEKDANILNQTNLIDQMRTSGNNQGDGPEEEPPDDQQ